MSLHNEVSRRAVRGLASYVRNLWKLERCWFRELRSALALGGNARGALGSCVVQTFQQLVGSAGSHRCANEPIVSEARRECLAKRLELTLTQQSQYVHDH